MDSTDLKIAVTASALTDNVREAPRIARRLGFAGLQFEAFSTALNLTDLSASGRREFRQMIGTESQQIASLLVDLGGKGLGAGADVDRAIDLLDRAMESAAGLMSPLVCVELGPLPEVPAAPRPKAQVSPELAGLIIIPSTAEEQPTPQPQIPAPDPRVVSQVDAALVEIGRRADRYGVMLALRAELATLGALERALRQAACPWFGVDLDPVGILRDSWGIDEVFAQFGSLIPHVRGRDAVGGAAGRTKAAVVGRGDVDWPHLLSNLQAADYQGWITVDPVDLPNRNACAQAALQRLQHAGK
ncbi:MAG TPA: TIM barrel protein [Humisphaera sp.]|jgi:sugar phosphate isomerase/epimerase|nr:TIM barrel protein [Humisphaera sp.]